QQLKQWQETLPQAASLMMSVNLSVKQFSSPHLIQDIDEILATTGLASSSLRLEITESALIDNLETAETILAAIRALIKASGSLLKFSTTISIGSLLSQLINLSYSAISSCN
ncbi:MAG: EAL domain-containing protein, partial [Microcoleus sp. T3-bin5]|nr:EAL domain-containing protein [Microcoleus sp. T3-bin5]